jgi:hypothetical protein
MPFIELSALKMYFILLAWAQYFFSKDAQIITFR